MIRRHVVVSGLVQGVWFRDSCRARARQLGVAGWVRNRSDGTVEAIFEGEADAVESMVAWCHDGPDAARVDEVAVAEQPVEGAAGFWVR